MKKIPVYDCMITPDRELEMIAENAKDNYRRENGKEPNDTETALKWQVEFYGDAIREAERKADKSPKVQEYYNRLFGTAAMAQSDEGIISREGVR